MEQKLVIKPDLKLVMTPMLQQALKILQLPTLELANLVRTELDDNPMLEESEDREAAEAEPVPEEETGSTEADHTSEVELSPDGTGPNGFDKEEWDRYFPAEDEYVLPKQEQETTSEFTQTQVTRPPTLEENLLWQLRLVCRGEEEFRIGEFIIGNLDDRGFLALPLADVAQQAKATEDMVADVLALVQSLEPAGIAARNVTESLLIQLRNLPERNPLAEAIVERHFEAMEKRQVDKIARAEKTGREEVIAALGVISQLDPFPGRHYYTEAVENVIPDVAVEEHDDQFVIIVKDEGLPALRISRANRQLMRRRAEMSPETRQYLEEKLQRAIWMIKSIEQRRKTLYRVMETIVEVQNDFFRKGVEYLKPLTLREIADRLQLHESTISRVTSKKYVQTPRGVFELKYFFSSHLKTADGGQISSTSVKAVLAELIAQEDPYHSLSDQRLQELLGQKGFQVARRTIAKYREEMNVLPASRRRRLE